MSCIFLYCKYISSEMETSIKLPNISPVVSANPFSKLFFCWVLPFLKYGSNHTLQSRDIYDTVESDSANVVTEELEKNWNYEQKKSRIKNRKPNLKKALLYSFGHSFMIYGLYLFIQSVFLRILHPIILVEYIRHFEEDNFEQGIEYYLATALIILALFNNLIYHHCFVGCSLIGNKAKVACSSLIQRKVLKLSQYALNRISRPRLAKLLSEDVKKIEAVSPYLHYLYIAPLQFLTSIYILFHTIGRSSLAGLFFILIISVPQGYMSGIQKEIQRQLSVITDSRIKLMKEILYGIRIIKMYGWEKPFENIVDKTKTQEINTLCKKAFTKCISISTVMFTHTLAVFLTLTAHIMLGFELKLEMVFVAVLIFYTLTQYMCYFLPEAIERYLDANAAILNIENFLTMEEKQEQMQIISYAKGLRKPGTIKITEGSAKWGIQPVLQNINVKIDPGTSCCIFGPTGSGKSSCLLMILKELPAISGRVDVTGTISYASQKPWFIPSSIKSNILFSQPYNRHKYREIVKLCSLNLDFQKLPYGDQTSINDIENEENGIKKKINLARAIYKEADIYIIDDTIGTIDYQIEKFIYSECIMKYLKNKTRVFVSNKLYYAKEADKIVVLENGSVNRVIESEDFNEADFHYLNTKLSPDKNNDVSSGPINFIEETELQDKEINQCTIENVTNKHGYFVTIGEFLKLHKNCLVEIVGVLLVVTQLFASFSEYWLAQWSQQELKNTSNPIPIPTYEKHNKTSKFKKIYYTILNDVIHGFYGKNITVQNDNITDTKDKILFGLPETDFNIACYAGIIICCIIFTVVRTLLYHALCMNSSRTLHNKMFQNVLFSPMKFFETFPLGTILKRFSKDMDVIYNFSSKNFATWQMYTSLCGTTMLILFAAPASIPPLMLVIIMIYFLMSAFVNTIRDLQKLENNAQYPICSFLTNSLFGVFTIRSGAAEEIVVEVFNSLLDKNTGISTMILNTSEYFCFYMDLLAIFFMGIAIFLVVIVNNVADGYNYSGLVGLAATQGIILTELLHTGIRESIETICSNSTMDRALLYTKLVKEDVEKCTLVPKNWPYCGKIVIKNVYIKDSDPHGSFLKNLNIVIKPAEKIAVVSRYPEEKWVIMNCLLRLVSVEGLVILDDVDTSSISLNKLRSSITVITRNPVLFSESVRFNLDPLDHASDEMLWKVLEETGLNTCIQSLSQPIIEGGFNFSSGQRQLLCLARAMLRNHKVLIIENNPPNIDGASENLIQKIIREKFKNCTILTIANSLSTIMENDKILVIEEGKEVEYAHAHELLQNPKGYLTNLVKETGQSMEENLKRIAKENFDSRNLQIEFKFE